MNLARLLTQLPLLWVSLGSCFSSMFELETCFRLLIQLLITASRRTTVEVIDGRTVSQAMCQSAPAGKLAYVA